MSIERLFTAYVGVDYSGAKGPDDRITGLTVFRANETAEPEAIRPSDTSTKWSRRLVAERLLDWLSGPEVMIVGMDHAFSFPYRTLKDCRMRSWDAFLDYFSKRWRTDCRSVESAKSKLKPMGQATEFRLTERWTSSARSVFVLDGPGQVGKSTHAGIPWLRYLRAKSGDRVHFWPFDGFEVPEGNSVIAEVYPALFSKRYDTGLKGHEKDAFAICRWLQDRDETGFLGHYFRPLLSQPETDTARLEGWILGVM